MGGTDQSSNKRSRKSKGGKKKRPMATGGATITREKDRTVTLPKLEPDGGMPKIPSNAPTMAIAPSDYEHIFHEAAGAKDPAPNAPADTPPSPPEPPRAPERRPPPPLLPTIQVHSPPVMPPMRPRTPDYDNYNERQNYDRPSAGYSTDVQVTPDGYTLLGQQSEPGHRRVALPPHVVRASNQFSRAALARVARYLASRADPPR